jgi:hypothetical protein
MTRDARAAAIASVAVLVVIIVGFRVLGGPGTQRLARSDERTVRALGELAQKIQQKFRGSDLPANLDSFPEKQRADPLTKKAFAYHPKSNTAYELCATFLTDTRQSEPGEADNPWRHPQGESCFQLDVTQTVPQFPYFYD